MNMNELPENPYLLLTPGPLSTTPTVKAVMLRDWCTWDRDYNDIVQDIRHRLVVLGGAPGFSAVLMQGSGTFSVEAAIGSMMPPSGSKLLVLANGAYGDRIAAIATALRIPLVVHNSGEMATPNIDLMRRELSGDPTITHVACVHCETTTGMLNPIETIGPVVKAQGRLFMVDAMSSFGGMPIDLDACGVDVLISSANKCIQGVPGFGFILVREALLKTWKGQARSLSLDVYDQWQTMESQGGKWRFTSPTHVVRAFAQALNELDAEGGIPARYARYRENQRILVEGMTALGYEPLLPRALQSAFITSFRNPANFSFKPFYEALKTRGFVIYPGKVSNAECFRIGTIGDVTPARISDLLAAVAGV
ncbi:MAG TPA: 2-aminoethylphosphonate--pyruvate transaminase [Verrucomicrobia bacterium]|nr:2-aminoethylphosphonate--pyruvate transaminase [Verrucomicrobiota bacterium]